MIDGNYFRLCIYGLFSQKKKIMRDSCYLHLCILRFIYNNMSFNPNNSSWFIITIHQTVNIIYQNPWISYHTISYPAIFQIKIQRINRNFYIRDIVHVYFMSSRCYPPVSQNIRKYELILLTHRKYEQSHMWTYVIPDLIWVSSQ